MKSLGKIAAICLSAVLALVFVAWVTSPDPRGNVASFEDAPLDARLAPLSEAITLARYPGPDGAPTTMIVTRVEGDTVFGVNISDLDGERSGNALRDLASVDRSRLTAERLGAASELSVDMSELLPVAPAGSRHIGTGTNFPEHAEESNSGSVFQFPKFGKATPARTTVKAPDGVLLDYEVELCIGFDRDIASLVDFDDAVKGIFLCGDMTNRNALVELADPDNLDSGFGFSDSKSGPDFYPSGPFLVVPDDWKEFVDGIRMTTGVNGEPRQDARGREMILDFRQLAEKALGDMEDARFSYRGDFHRLADGNRISADMTLMSGTSEGVIFMPPTRADYIEGVMAYIFAGGPLSDTGLIDTVKRTFIANELATKHFLQAGDLVRHDSNLLGNIEVRIVAP